MDSLRFSDPKALVVHGRRRPFYLGLGRMSYRQLRSLPTTTTGLAHRVRVIARRQVGRQHRLPRTADLYRYTAFALLRDAYENPTTSALRAAVWRLLARTPGLRLNGRVTDDAGRPGIAVSQVIGPVRFRIVVDPARGRLLEYDRYLVRREGTEPPGLIWRAVFLASGVVDSDGARAESRVRTP